MTPVLVDYRGRFVLRGSRRIRIINYWIMLPVGNIQLSLNPLAQIVMSATGGAGTANFTGGFPSGALTTNGGVFVFAPSAEQGLLDPQALGINNPLRVIRIELVMAGQSTWTLNLIDTNTATASTAALASGTTDTVKVIEGVDFLFPGQKLQLVTTGASTTSVKMTTTLSNPNIYPITP